MNAVSPNSLKPAAPAGERQQRIDLQRAAQQTERVRHAVGEREDRILQ